MWALVLDVLSIWKSRSTTGLTWSSIRTKAKKRTWTISKTPTRSSHKPLFTSQCLNDTFEGSVSVGGAASKEISSPSRRADGATDPRTSKTQILVSDYQFMKGIWNSTDTDTEFQLALCQSQHLRYAGRNGRWGSLGGYCSQRTWTKVCASN